MQQAALYFPNLDYPVNLINSSINEFLHIDNLDTPKNANDYTPSIMIPLPFKNRQSANLVKDKCRIGAPTLVSTLNLSSRARRLTKRRRPLLLAINAWFSNSNAICATQIMSGTQPEIYTNAPATGKNIEEQGLTKSTLEDKQFYILKKCRSKLDCLIFALFFYRNSATKTKPGVSRR